MTPPASTTPSAPSVPEKDQPYRRSCLLVDSKCPAEERENALYDYVGAVYGEKGKVHFGRPDEKQVLTAKEKSYVTSKFGLLKSGQDQDMATYLSQAREIFFNDLRFNDLRFTESSVCLKTKIVWPDSLNHVDFGVAWVFHGAHGCGRDYGDQLLKSGVELSIAADPTPWRFFLESYGTELAKEVRLEEMALFTKIAKTLDIPLRDPLPLQAHSLEVRSQAAKSSNKKYTVDDFAVAIVFQVAAAAARDNPGSSSSDIFKSVIAKLAPELAISREQLFDKTRSFLRAFPTMEGQLEESDQRVKLLADTSNRMNEEKLRKLLSAEKKPHRSLFIVGSSHLDLVKSVYSPKK